MENLMKSLIYPNENNKILYSRDFSLWFYLNIFDDHLNSNDVGFYFDFQDGKYGYNTSSNRGADTFSPFRTPHTNTYTATSRSTSIDLGLEHVYRYINTNSVPNTNSGTYTYSSGSTGGTVDLGDTNTYRYVNASNVYNKGKADGSTALAVTTLLNGGKNSTYTFSAAYKYVVAVSCDNANDGGKTLNFSGSGTQLVKSSLSGTYCIVMILKNVAKSASIRYSYYGWIFGLN